MDMLTDTTHNADDILAVAPEVIVADSRIRDLRHRDPSKEGTLVIAGFFGRGNAGDEAMLQVLFEVFSPRFRIVICVDEYGAYPGFWDWYPYNEAIIAHQNRFELIKSIADPVGVLVGGGGLAVGFAAAQVFIARTQQLPTALAGVDIFELHKHPRAAPVLRTWLGLFDQVIPRTSRSESVMRALDMPSLHGGDWALRLAADVAPDVTVDDHRALVVLREDVLGEAGNDYRAGMRDLLSQLAACGYGPVFLPFSPEDERFLTTQGLVDGIPVERAWWNARRLKQLIASSGLTVTVGRLHPMVFAAPTGRDVASIRPPHWIGKRAAGMSKLTDMGKELGIDQFESVGDFGLALRAGKIRPAQTSQVEAALARVDTALDALHTLFAEYVPRAVEPVVE